MLVTNYQLSDHELDALSALSTCCQLTDGGLPVLYYHLLKQKRDNPSNVLCYRDGILAGFLSVHFFYETACEVSLLISPSYRRQGIAKQMLQQLLPLLRQQDMKNVIFSMSGSVETDWLEEKSFYYYQSDFQMERDSYKPIILNKNVNKNALSIRKAALLDLPILTKLDALCFETNESSSTSRFEQILASSHYSVFVGSLPLHNQIIGKAHIRWEDQQASFSDIAINPIYQRQGFGSELLTHCINHALTQGIHRLLLHVETTNHQALSLYQRHGFHSTQQHNYWSIPLSKLEEELTKIQIPNQD